MNDDQDLQQAISVRRQAALKRLEHARMLQARAVEQERLARVELDELNIAERVYRKLSGGSERIDEIVLALQDKNSRRLAASSPVEVLWGSPEGSEYEAHLASRKQKDHVLRVCLEQLADGSFKTTEELTATLPSYGVHLTAANKEQRVSQILSADERFQAQRGRGWSLVTTTPPAPTPPSDESDLDTRLRRAAREVVDNPKHR